MLEQPAVGERVYIFRDKREMYGPAGDLSGRLGTCIRTGTDLSDVLMQSDEGDLLDGGNANWTLRSIIASPDEPDDTLLRRVATIREALLEGQRSFQQTEGLAALTYLRSLQDY